MELDSATERSRAESSKPKVPQLLRLYFSGEQYLLHRAAWRDWEQ